MERILVINPGSTSTKIAVFDDDNPILNETIRHENDELAPFQFVMDQVDFRKNTILDCLANNGIAVNSLSCIMARGGQLPPVPSGAFPVDKNMVDFLSALKEGAHISNAACVIAYTIIEENKLNIPAYVYDPVATDELSDIARITGLPELPKQSRGHALNTHAAARHIARETLKRPIEECTFVVAHLGGGCSIWLIEKGYSRDLYSDDDGTFCPERCGRLQAVELIRLCYSGKYTFGEMMNFVRRDGGFKAHLGTSDAREVERRIEAGDEKAKLVYEAFAYNVAKNIGDLCTAAKGKVDNIILTGGIAHSKMLTELIISYVDWIAPVIVYAGEFEMEALAAGGLRVIRGEEQPKSINWPKK